MNFLNILYYYVQRCIASSNNSNLDTKSHLSTEIVLVNLHFWSWILFEIQNFWIMQLI